MSLILEALRKSEAERRRGLAPDVAMELPPTPTARPRALSAWLLPALFFSALLVLAVWWAKREPMSTLSAGVTVQATDTPLAQDTPAPVLTPRIEPTPAAPALASAPALETPPPVALIQVQTPPAPSPVPASTTTTATASIPPPRPAPIQPPPARPLPPQPTSDISNDTSMLPPIKLSMHMWDDVPSRRFVILNGQRMAEGDRYGAITVVAIERAGVVVEANGARARVPLP